MSDFRLIYYESPHTGEYVVSVYLTPDREFCIYSLIRPNFMPEIDTLPVEYSIFRHIQIMLNKQPVIRRRKRRYYHGSKSNR